MKPSPHCKRPLHNSKTKPNEVMQTSSRPRSIVQTSWKEPTDELTMKSTTERKPREKRASERWRQQRPKNVQRHRSGSRTSTKRRPHETRGSLR